MKIIKLTGTLFLLFLYNATYSVNFDQKLAELLTSKDWFGIEQYYQDHKDSISANMRLWYMAETSKVFNRPKVSISAYTELITENPFGWDTLSLIGYFGVPLLQLCGDEFEFQKGVDASKNMLLMIQNDSVSDENLRQGYIQYLENAILAFKKGAKDYSKTDVTKIKKSRKSEINLILNKNSNDIIFRSLCNDKPVKFLFDTGAGVCFIWNKNTAKKIGLKVNNNDTILLGQTKTVSGIIDSLEVGPYQFKNVPVFVSIDEIDKNDPKQVKCDSILSSVDIVLGMPILKRLERVQLDFNKHTMIFSDESINNTDRDKNMYIEKNGLFLDMKVLDNSFCAFFDTGFSGGLVVNSAFYNTTKDLFPSLDKMDPFTNYSGGCSASNAKVIDNVWQCNDIRISIGNQTIDLIKNCRVSKEEKDDAPNGTKNGGVLGNHILKYGKKFLFDFQEMRFSIL